MDFISVPVSSGFLSAGSLIIIIAQLQGLLGLRIKSKNIADNLYKIVKNINKIRPADFTLGIFSIVFLLVFRVSVGIIKADNLTIVEVLYRLCL